VEAISLLNIPQKNSKGLGPVKLNDLLRQMVNHYRHFAQQNNVTLSSDIPSETLVVMAEASQLADVIAGYLSNAIQYTNVAGRVNVKLEKTGENTAHLVRDRYGYWHRFPPHRAYLRSGSRSLRWPTTAGLVVWASAYHSLRKLLPIIAAGYGLRAAQDKGQLSTLHFHYLISNGTKATTWQLNTNDQVLVIVSDPQAGSVIERVLSSLDVQGVVCKDGDAVRETLQDDDTCQLLICSESIPRQHQRQLSTELLSSLPAIPQILLADEPSPEVYKMRYAGIQ
jgi:hypothetical protein